MYRMLIQLSGRPGRYSACLLRLLFGMQWGPRGPRWRTEQGCLYAHGPCARRENAILSFSGESPQFSISTSKRLIITRRNAVLPSFPSCLIFRTSFPHAWGRLGQSWSTDHVGRALRLCVYYGRIGVKRIAKCSFQNIAIFPCEMFIQSS